MFTKSADFYEALYSWKDYAAEAVKLHDLIEQHKQSPGSALLEVACGTGAHIAHLRQYYTITGLDLDSAMLNIARQSFPDVKFHQADMCDFDLGTQFDCVTCLFSSIGYVKTVSALHQAIGTMTHHLKPGGVLIVEPWLRPDQFTQGHVAGLYVDQLERKIARMNIGIIENGVSILDFHYMVATKEGITNFTERHELGLFTHEEYLASFDAAGLKTIYDPVGLMDRGLYIGLNPESSH